VGSWAAGGVRGRSRYPCAAVMLCTYCGMLMIGLISRPAPGRVTVPLCPGTLDALPKGRYHHLQSYTRGKLGIKKPQID
jgi:hypothetical protein